MEFEKLGDLLLDEIITKLEGNQGLSIFAKTRAKFEGWLKVECCGILSNHFSYVAPEKDWFDIVFDNWAIELKTVNTNYRYEKAENKIRPITKNVQGVIDDIEKLKSSRHINKAALFVVFPVTHDHEKWQKHLQKIYVMVREIKFKEFKFKGGLPGVIYFVLIR
ncbi:hypothetical protein HQ584_12690 [Patescibacteria group bacterium]|nr:hypothetical protein [Patescibacteria group bacterium]